MNKKLLSIVLPLFIMAPATFAIAATQCTGVNNNIGCYAGNIKEIAINIASPIVIIGWIIAGILYLLAAGSPEKINVAKKAVVACVIGTVLVVLALGTGPIIDVIKNSLGLGGDSSQTPTLKERGESCTLNNQCKNGFCLGGFCN